MERLERAVETQLAAPDEQVRAEAEAEEARRQLEAVRDENARLRAAKDDIEHRLDDAIVRLRSVLEA